MRKQKGWSALFFMKENIHLLPKCRYIIYIIPMAVVFIQMIILLYQVVATSKASKCMMGCYEAVCISCLDILYK
jgi:hypothetical protein